MADTTKIEWTDATWNPITGCKRAAGHLLDGQAWQQMPGVESDA